MAFRLASYQAGSLVSDIFDEFLNALSLPDTHIPGGKDLALEVIVLRAHLLIERQLKGLVGDRFVKATAYDLSRPKLSEVLRLAEALYGDHLPVWIWRAIQELGIIRNSLAHRLTDALLEPRVHKLIKMVSDNSPTYSDCDDSTLEHLKQCVNILHSELLILRHL